MILRRLIILAVLVSGVAVSGCVAIVGLIYALYALLKPYVGTPGAEAIMFGGVASALGGGAIALLVISRPKKVVVKIAEPTATSSMVDTLAQTVRERPVVVILAAIGAGVLAVRNPRYLASTLRAFTAPRVVED